MLALPEENLTNFLAMPEIIRNFLIGGIWGFYCWFLFKKFIFPKTIHRT
jgi:hypothetical protein